MECLQFPEEFEPRDLRSNRSSQALANGLGATPMLLWVPILFFRAKITYAYPADKGERQAYVGLLRDSLHPRNYPLKPISAPSGRERPGAAWVSILRWR